MTYQQKMVMLTLFAGGTIAYNGEGDLRLRDAKQNPLVKLNAKTFKKLKPLIQHNKRLLYVYNPKAIRRLRKNSWVRIEYLERHKNKSLIHGK